MSTDLVFLGDDGEPFTTSLVIANETGNEHASVMRLIHENLEDLNDVGLVGFEIRPRPEGQHGGGDMQYALLDEPASALLMTYLRNSPVVKDFKKRLVRGFYEMRRQLAAPIRELTPLEYARRLVDAEERAEADKIARAQAESRADELEGPASAYNELVAIKCDLKVADAAKILSRDPHIREIGQNRLFRYMSGINWCFRNRDNGRWCAYQSAVDRRWLFEMPGEKYYDQRVSEHRVGDPVVLVTPKGLQELHKRLGGGQLSLEHS